MVTLHDVARLAGVSTATVSRVVHGQDRVREPTRIRVRRAIEELGYVPDGAGRSLSRRRKDVIGLVCDQEWSLLVTFLQGWSDPRLTRLEAFSGKVDGILIGGGSSRRRSSSAWPPASPS